MTLTDVGPEIGGESVGQSGNSDRGHSSHDILMGTALRDPGEAPSPSPELELCEAQLP